MLSLRGTDIDGEVSYRNHEVLVNAKDEMPSEDEITEIGKIVDPAMANGDASGDQQ